MSLPETGRPSAMLSIHHETIPTFRDRSGTVHRNSDGSPGMKEMIMDFPALAPGLSLKDIAVGDPVEFTIDVKWAEVPPYRVTHLVELPSETKLNLGKVRDP